MLVLDRNIPQAGFFSGQIMIYTNKMLHSNVFTLLKRVNFVISLGRKGDLFLWKNLPA